MSNQTISEAVKDLATAMAHDFYDRYAGKASLSQTRQAFIETVIRARALDAAARVEPTGELLLEASELLEKYVKCDCKWDNGHHHRCAVVKVHDWRSRLHNASLPATPTPQGETSEQTGLAPCPFCGKLPNIRPEDARMEGNCWGEVSCRNSECPARPMVRDDIRINDDRGSEKYIERAIVLWNKRAAPQSTQESGGASLGAATDKEETALCPYHGNYYSPAQCGVCSKIVAPATTLGAREERDGQTGDIFATLRSANLARQAAWCPGQTPPDLSFRGNELAGETGEVCNVIKKLERVRLGWRGSLDTVEHLAEELGDVVICADLIGIAAGIDLQSAIVAKFNATSEKVGLPHRLASAPPSPQPQTGEEKRPDWFKLYGYEPPTLRPQELVSVTRHTADLAQSALRDRMEKQYYHNDEAACRELNDALAQPQVAEGKEEPKSGWIRTADRRPTKGDAVDGEVLAKFERSGHIVMKPHEFEKNPMPYWMPIPPVEGQQKYLGER